MAFVEALVRLQKPRLLDAIGLKNRVISSNIGRPTQSHALLSWTSYRSPESYLKDNRGRIHCPVMPVTVSLTATGITYISNRRQALLFGITLPCHIFSLEPLDFMTLRTYNTFRRRKEELLWPIFMRS